MSTTFLETLNPNPLYTLRAPAPAAEPARAAGTPSSPSRSPNASVADSYAEDMSWEDFSLLLLETLKPYPEARLAVSHAIRRYHGLPIPYPIESKPHEPNA